MSAPSRTGAKQTTAWLEKYDNAWLTEHRADNKRTARWFFALGLFVLVPLGVLVSIGLRHSWPLAIGAGVIAVAWLYFFVIRQVVYVMRTGDFR